MDPAPAKGAFREPNQPAASLKGMPITAQFEFQAFKPLPCGCVAAAYRARPWDVAVVSLEAKGPHCILAGHNSGQILRLGDPAERKSGFEHRMGREFHTHESPRQSIR